MESTLRTGKRASDRPVAGVAVVEAITPADYDRLIAGFDDSLPEQTADFAALRWPRHRRETCAIRRDGEIIAAALVVVVEWPLLPGGLAAVKWGPLWRRQGQSADVRDYTDAIAALRTEYAARRGLALLVMPPASPAHELEMVQALRVAGFAARAPEAFPDRFFIDLRAGEEAIRKGFSAKWRYNLKIAERASFEMRFVSGSEGLAEFMSLYEAMLLRKKFADDSPIAALPGLLAAREPAHRPMILLVDHDGRPTAGAVVSTTGDTARYLFGASDERALALKPGYAMQWAILRALCRRKGLAWYALGGTDGASGLYQFKRGMIGSGGVIAVEPSGHIAAASRLAAFGGHSLLALRDARHWLQQRLGAGGAQ